MLSEKRGEMPVRWHEPVRGQVERLVMWHEPVRGQIVFQLERLVMWALCDRLVMWWAK